MTKSSRTRRAKARARKVAAKTDKVTMNASSFDEVDANESKLSLTGTDKRYLIGFGIISLLITAVYWWMGGRNLFVFPAIFCLSVGARKYWTGPVRKFADKSSG